MPLIHIPWTQEVDHHCYHTHTLYLDDLPILYKSSSKLKMQWHFYILYNSGPFQAGILILLHASISTRSRFHDHSHLHSDHSWYASALMTAISCSSCATSAMSTQCPSQMTMMRLRSNSMSDSRLSATRLPLDRDWSRIVSRLIILVGDSDTVR